MTTTRYSYVMMATGCAAVHRRGKDSIATAEYGKEQYTMRDNYSSARGIASVARY